MKFLDQAFSRSKTTNHRTQKDWTALLDEMAALAVKARDGFRCRAYECRKQWQPVMLPSGRVVIAENCHWAHIFPRARGLALRHEMENGLTLCYAHHKAFDAMTENEKFDFLLENGARHELYYDLQRRSRELVPDLDGRARATKMLNCLREALRGCESFGLEMDVVLAFFVKRMKE